MNYPINSQFDDIMFIPDSLMRYAYFSSDRASKEGYITVYKVRIDQFIKVNDILALDKPDSSIIDKNTQYVQTLKFLKEKASLEVNANENMFIEKDTKSNDIINVDNNQKETQEDDNYKIPDNFTNEDIIKMANKQAEDSKKELEGLKIQKNAAGLIAKNKKLQAENNYKEADNISANAENIKDNTAREIELAKAVKLRSEAAQLKKESVIATNISDEIDEKILLKQKETNDATQYAKEIKTAIQSNSVDTSIALLTKMIEKIQNSAEDTNNYVTKSDSNIEFIKSKEKASETYSEQAKQIQEEVNSIKDQADSFRKEAASSKKKSIKEQYLEKANELDAEAKTKQGEADAVIKKSEKSNAEADSARAQYDLYLNIADDIKNNNISSASYSNSNLNNLTNNIENNKSQNTTKTVTKQNTSIPVADINSNNKVIINNETANDSVSSISKLTKEEQKLKTEIITKTGEIIKEIQKDADDLKKKSDNAYLVANEKNLKSIEKLKSSNDLIAENNEQTSTKEKEKNITQADDLRKESITLAQQSVISFSIAKNLENSYNEKLQQIIDINKSSDEINELIKSDKIKEAENKLTVLKTISETKSTADKVNKQYSDELSNKLYNVENELKQATSKIEKNKFKIDSLTGKLKTIQKEASNTNNKSKKDELLKQAEQTETQLSLSQKQADDVIKNADKLKFESEELKIKIKYSPNLISETENYKKSNNTILDKTELEKKITEYSNNNIFSDTITEKQSASITENTPVDQVNKTGQTKEVSNNVSEKSNITDYKNADEYEAKAVLIDKTVNSINNKVTVLKNELNKENDKLRIEKITKEITNLQNDAATLKQKAEDNHYKALKLNDSKNVTPSSNFDDTTLAKNIESNASDDIKKSVQKTKEANNETDLTKKEKLQKEVAELDETALTKQLEALEIYGIANTNIYYVNSLKIDKIRVEDEKNTQLVQAGLMENESKYYFEKAKVLRESIKDFMTVPQKKTILENAKSNELIAISKQSKALDMYSKALSDANNLKTSASITNQAANYNTTTVNNNANSTLIKQNTETQNVNKETVSTAASALITNNSSSDKTNSNRNTDNIKLNIDSLNLAQLYHILPSQITYKVQIAAFKKYVALDFFKGVTPLVVETTNTGFMRYMVGLYAKYEDADASKNQLRKLGYADAFVVAYYNGKRISIQEAKKLLEENGYTTGFENTLNKPDLNSQSIPESRTNISDTTGNSGIIFKVQIGAFDKNITVDVLNRFLEVANGNGLENLVNSEGLSVYTSGKFRDFNSANKYKNALIAKDFKDAFVIAFLNGQKIDVAKALELLK